MPEKRILLVEDERDLREVLALGLRRAGYTVDVAVTAAAPGVPHGSEGERRLLAGYPGPAGRPADDGDGRARRAAAGRPIRQWC
jgi:hypothetical protein